MRRTTRPSGPSSAALSPPSSRSPVSLRREAQAQESTRTTETSTEYEDRGRDEFAAEGEGNANANEGLWFSFSSFVAKALLTSASGERETQTQNRAENQQQQDRSSPAQDDGKREVAREEGRGAPLHVTSETEEASSSASTSRSGSGRSDVAPAAQRPPRQEQQNHEVQNMETSDHNDAFLFRTPNDDEDDAEETAAGSRSLNPLPDADGDALEQVAAAGVSGEDKDADRSDSSQSAQITKRIAQGDGDEDHSQSSSSAGPSPSPRLFARFFQQLPLQQVHSVATQLFCFFQETILDDLTQLFKYFVCTILLNVDDFPDWRQLWEYCKTNRRAVLLEALLYGGAAVFGIAAARFFFFMYGARGALGVGFATTVGMLIGFTTAYLLVVLVYRMWVIVILTTLGNRMIPPILCIPTFMISIFGVGG